MSYTITSISCLKCKKAFRFANFERHADACFQCLYPKTPQYVICKNCGVNHGYYGKTLEFCSRTCSGTYNNTKRFESGWRRTEESRAKTSNSLKARKKQDKLNQPKYNVDSDPNKKLSFNYKSDGVKIDKETKSPFSPVYSCHNCKKYFFRFDNTKGPSNCSPECTHEIMSRKARANRGLGTKRSKLEIELHDLCELSFPNVTSNIKMFDGWDADILLNDHKVAILWNGPWHYREMNFGNHSLKQVQNRDRIKTKIFNDNGWAVEVFEDRHFTPQSAHDALVVKYMQ